MSWSSYRFDRFQITCGVERHYWKYRKDLCEIRIVSRYETYFGLTLEFVIQCMPVINTFVFRRINRALLKNCWKKQIKLSQTRNPGRPCTRRWLIRSGKRGRIFIRIWRWGSTFYIWMLPIIGENTENGASMTSETYVLQWRNRIGLNIF